MNYRKIIGISLFLVWFVAGCDYVGQDILPNFQLTQEQFDLVSNSDDAGSYTFEFTGNLDLGDALTSGTRLNLSGNGAYSVGENEVIPNMRYDIYFENTDNGMGAWLQFISVDGNYYNRTVLDVTDTATPWSTFSIQDFTASTGFSLGPGDDVPTSFFDLLNGFGVAGLPAYTTISTNENALVVIDGEESRLFTIEADLGALVTSSEFATFFESDEAAQLYPELSQDELAEQIPLMQTLFQDVVVSVDQYVGLDSRAQKRSVTQMTFNLPAVSEDGALVDENFELGLFIDTKYRNIGDPVAIEVPANVVVAGSGSQEVTTDSQDSTTPNPTINQDVVTIETVNSGVQLSDVQATISPPSFDSQAIICSDRSFDTTMSLTFPPIPNPRTEVDVVFAIDVTNSMEDEVSVVQDTITNVATSLQSQDPNVRFALVTFADYPVQESEDPYLLLTDFTQDFGQLQSAANSITNTGGGVDWEESLLLPLHNIASFNWRSDAHRIVILITDSHPRDVDPGADGEFGTADDLSVNQVLSEIHEADLTIIGLQADNIGLSRQFLQELAVLTDGFYRRLQNAGEIQQYVIELVTLATDGTVDLEPVGANFRVVTEGNNWLSLSQDEFEYPLEGGTVDVELTVTPSELISLPDGQYQFVIDIQGGGGTRSYGRFPVTFNYDNVCADVFIPDNLADDGRLCSDIDEVVYWDSPAIFVRSAPTDNPAISEFPTVGQINYVYVNVTNLGPLDAPDVTLEVFANDEQFKEVFDDTWVSLGTLIEPSLTANQSTILGPFEWVPTQPHVTLRAVVRTEEDGTFEDINDVACENNIAVQSRIPMVLDNASYGEGVIGGNRSISLNATLTYASLDLVVGVDRLAGDDSYVALDMDNTTYQNWSTQAQDIRNGRVLPSGRIQSTRSNSLMVIEEMVSSSDTFQADVNLLVVSSLDGSSGVLPIGLQAQDRIITGSSVYYVQDDSAIPNLEASPTIQPLQQDEAVGYPYLTPVVIAGLLVLILVGIYLNRMR